jgi:hypothetical protein
MMEIALDIWRARAVDALSARVWVAQEVGDNGSCLWAVMVLKCLVAMPRMSIIPIIRSASEVVTVMRCRLSAARKSRNTRLILAKRVPNVMQNPTAKTNKEKAGLDCYEKEISIVESILVSFAHQNTTKEWRYRHERVRRGDVVGRERKWWRWKRHIPTRRIPKRVAERLGLGVCVNGCTTTGQKRPPRRN